MTSFICCFCSRPIVNELAVEIIVPIEAAEIQNLWAHGSCLAALLHPSVPKMAEPKAAH